MQPYVSCVLTLSDHSSVLMCVCVCVCVISIILILLTSYGVQQRRYFTVTSCVVFNHMKVHSVSRLVDLRRTHGISVTWLVSYRSLCRPQTLGYHLHVLPVLLESCCFISFSVYLLQPSFERCLPLCPCRVHFSTFRQRCRFLFSVCVQASFIFSRTLHCKFRYLHKMSSVCDASVCGRRNVNLQIRMTFTDFLVHYQPTFTLPMNNPIT